MTQLKQNPMFRFLMVLTISSTIGLQAWTMLFNNFAVEQVHLSGEQVGMIQSVREIPGFLTFLAVFVMMVIREHRLSAISIVTLGAGFALTGFFPSYAGLMMTTVLMSFGFHYYETTNQSLTLQYFDKYQSPVVFGRLRSIAAASSIGIGIFVFLISHFLSFRSTYLAIGGVIFAAGLWAFTQNPVDKNIIPQHKKMIFRKKYWLYYFLTFMAGARRQIFMAFAVLLLVKKFEFSVQEVTALFVINNVINYFLSPMVGKYIVRVGERKILSLEYFSLLFIFLAYALVDSKLLVSFLYVLDHIFFNFAIAIRTYFQKVGDPKDIAPSMAVGFTINHIAAVFLPALGGILWMVDYRIPFLAGAGMSIVSLIAVQKIHVPAET